MIVDADVTDVRRHQCDGPFASDIEEFGFTGGIELQNRTAELEALRPLGPAAASVFPASGEHRRA